MAVTGVLLVSFFYALVLIMSSNFLKLCRLNMYESSVDSVFGQFENSFIKGKDVLIANCREGLSFLMSFLETYVPRRLSLSLNRN